MRRTKFGYAVAGAIGVGIIAIGARFVLDPVVAAAGFGVPGTPPSDPYYDVKGVRDIGTGLVLLALLATGRGLARRRAVGAAMLAASAIPLGDAAIVLSHGGARSVALGVHGATAAVAMAGALALLTARPSQDERPQPVRAGKPGLGRTS